MIKNIKILEVLLYNDMYNEKNLNYLLIIKGFNFVAQGGLEPPTLRL